nr:alpha/beta hydrolase-fold protein [Arsukibacterium sp.]
MITTVLAVGAVALFKAQQYKEDYTSDFIDETIYSSVLGESRKIFIRLPGGYERSKEYPLIIKTDGNFNLKRWDETLAELSSQSITEDSIIVAIPNLFWVDSRNRDLVPPYARRDVNIEARPDEDNHPDIFGKADRFLAFIETELIPYLEKNYAINDNRLLSGFSAGGSLVLYTIVTKPDLFSGYLAFSPAAWYDDSVVVKEFAKNLPVTDGKPIFLYLSLGGEENEIITGSFKGLLSALETNAPANLQWAYSYSEGAGHNANPYVSVPKALTKYYEFCANKNSVRPVRNAHSVSSTSN